MESQRRRCQCERFTTGWEFEQMMRRPLGLDAERAGRGDTHPGHALNYNVSPDGRKFLLLRRAAEENTSTPAQVTLVLNWFEELKRLVPVK